MRDNKLAQANQDLSSDVLKPSPTTDPPQHAPLEMSPSVLKCCPARHNTDPLVRKRSPVTVPRERRPAPKPCKILLQLYVRSGRVLRAVPFFYSWFASQFESYGMERGRVWNNGRVTVAAEKAAWRTVQRRAERQTLIATTPIDVQACKSERMKTTA